MPTANLGNVSANRLLTDWAVAYHLQDEVFAHGRVFPHIGLDEENARYYRWDRGDSLRTEATTRRPGARFPRKDVGVEQVPIQLEQYAIERAVPREILNSEGSPYGSTMRPAIRHIVNDLMIRREVDFVDRFVVPGGSTPWANADAAAGTAWTAAGGTPITHVRTAARTVQLACGFRPNTLLLSRAALDAAMDNAQVLGRLADNEIKNADLNTLAMLFGVDRVVVSDAVRNTAGSGATYSGAVIMPAANALLVYQPSTPSIDEPSAGYIFGWTEFDNVRQLVAGTGAAAVRSYYEEQTRSDVAQASIYYRMEITDAGAGIRLTGIV